MRITSVEESIFFSHDMYSCKIRIVKAAFTFESQRHLGNKLQTKRRNTKKFNLTLHVVSSSDEFVSMEKN